MSSLVTYVVQVSSTLLVFGVIAAALIHFGRRSGRRPAGPLELLDRLHLGGRRVVYLVRAGERVLVVGGSEGGLTRLGELDASALPRTTPRRSLGARREPPSREPASREPASREPASREPTGALREPGDALQRSRGAGEVPSASQEPQGASPATGPGPGSWPRSGAAGGTPSR